MLGTNETQVQELADAIARVKKDIVLCDECFDLTDHSPCAVCRDSSRETGVVCVVEEPADLAAVERAGGFRGRYHVLGGALAHRRHGAREPPHRRSSRSGCGNGA